MAQTRKTGSDFLAFCADLIDKHCQASGLTGRAASETALRVIEATHKQFGGDSIYFAKGYVASDERAAQVHAMWQAGSSITEIAEHYDFTVRWAYKLLAIERDRLRKIRRTVERAHPSAHSLKCSPPEAPTQTQHTRRHQPQEGDQR